MTDTEIQALRDELQNATDSIKKLEDKNREVILKNKRLSTEYSEEKFNELLERNEALENANLKYEADTKTYKRDFEKLTETNSGLNATNTKLIMDDGFTKELMALERHSVRDGGMDVTIEALKKHNPTIIDGVAMFGDKSAKDFISEWSNSDSSKFYLQSKENSGGGSNGSNGSGGGGQKLSTMSEAERNTLFRSNPTEFNRLVQENK